MKIGNQVIEFNDSQNLCSIEKGNFYVSLYSEGRLAILSGPYAFHREAIENIERVKEEANRVDPINSAFGGFGTVNICGCTKPGILNKKCNFPLFS